MKIDSHIHTFNHKKSINLPDNYDYDIKICFMDIEYDDIQDVNFIDSYKNYIESSHNEKDILLATGKNIDDIKQLLEKFPNKFKGFGELKLYDKYKGVKINYKKISILKDVCHLSSKNGNLPIYIHWEINDENDVRKIKSVLEQFPNIYIVLCHCGLSKDDELKSYSYLQVCNLMREHSNLWIDISYEALDYFSRDVLKLFNLQLDRVIVGSDINNKLVDKENYQKIINDIISKTSIIRSYVDSDKNTKTLFNLK